MYHYTACVISTLCCLSALDQIEVDVSPASSESLVIQWDVPQSVAVQGLTKVEVSVLTQCLSTGVTSLQTHTANSSTPQHQQFYLASGLSKPNNTAL